MYRVIFLLIGLFAASAAAADEQPLIRLMQGNERYVQDAPEHPNRNLERRAALVAKQKPFAVIVGCADSRVPPELIFDQGAGDLFVVRVAGNVIGPIELDSIEYAAIYLNSSVILVLGHENCGAVGAVIAGTTKDIESVAELIEPAVKETREKNPPDLLTASIKANALRMRDYLLETPHIKQLAADKKIEVRAGYYHLQTGVVELLGD